ncbi:MAG: lipopolysaccharide heptosyltransferase II [Kiritimatiellales bacterium]|nr:lipopolysaccharide heptosyltransferase II [Kiritimatiellales bacterium]
MATPVYECLRNNFPDARITALIRPYAKGILEDAPWFDSIIDCNDKKRTGMRETVRQIRKTKPDMAILLPNSLRAYTTVLRGGARKIYGYRRNVQRFFLSGGPTPKRDENGFLPLPMIEYYLEICRSMGLEIQENPKPALYISPALEKAGDEYLERFGITAGDLVVGLNPGAKFGSSKCWPPEYFAKLADLLHGELGCKILLLVGPGEEGIAQQIEEKATVPVVNTSSDIADLAMLKPLIKRCDLLVTNDTGPRHYAVAFDRPVVVLMGPTDSRYTASNLDKTVVLQKTMGCVPCHLKTCPDEHRCMCEITPQEVCEAVLGLCRKESVI